MSEPRYAPANRLLEMVLALQNSTVGLSYSDLSQRLSVERRTVERMMDALRLRPDLDLDHSLGDDQQKLWRLKGRKPPLQLAITRDELVALETAARELRRPAHASRRAALISLADKVRPLIASPNRYGVESDALELAELEGHALRPGPREILDPQVLETLREAMLQRTKVRIALTYRTTGKEGVDTVRPYGLLHGAETYLVAYSENEWAKDIRMFALDSIRTATPLAHTFTRPKNWTLEKYAAQSFGIWREKPVNVEWRFSPQVAEQAARWVFHPNQRSKRNKDSSLTVRFRAGGLKEMAWHLGRWSGEVDIIRPRTLRTLWQSFEV